MIQTIQTIKPGLVNRLRSVAIGVTDVKRSIDFYTTVWGLEIVHQSENMVLLRAAGSDHHVLALLPEQPLGLVSMTFGTKDREALDVLYLQLRDAGVRIDPPPRELPGPGGGYGFSFKDPEGRLIKVVAGRLDHGDMLSGKHIPTKISHVVLNSMDSSVAARFMQERLGMKLSDQTGMLHFLRCNQDHHSLAFAKTGNTSLNHIAFEMPNWDALMYGMGRVKNAGYKVHWGLGRHGPGDNVFVYFLDPDGYAVEYTAEIQQIDEATHRAKLPGEWVRPKNLDSWGVSDMPSDDLEKSMHGEIQLGMKSAH